MTDDTSNPFDQAAKDAADKTNNTLAKEEARVATLDRNALKKMVPDPLDQQGLDELIKIVNQATSHNEQVAALIANISKVGGVVVKLLSRIR